MFEGDHACGGGARRGPEPWLGRLDAALAQATFTALCGLRPDAERGAYTIVVGRPKEVGCVRLRIDTAPDGRPIVIIHEDWVRGAPPWGAYIAAFERRLGEG